MLPAALGHALLQLPDRGAHRTGGPPKARCGNYLDYFRKGFYLTLTGRSLMLGVYVTGLCLLLGFPAALALAKYVKGRWREALFLLVVLPFWSNALVRTFSWTMVLRTDGLIDRAIQDGLSRRAPSRHPVHLSRRGHRPRPQLPALHDPHLLHLAAGDRRFPAGGGAQPGRRRLHRLPAHPPAARACRASLAGTILIFVPVIGSFMEPRILGGPGGFMLGNVIEDQFTVVFNWPLGAALSFILLAIVLLILAACYPLLRRNLQGLA